MVGINHETVTIILGQLQDRALLYDQKAERAIQGTRSRREADEHRETARLLRFAAVIIEGCHASIET